MFLICGAIAVVKAAVTNEVLKDLLRKNKERVMELLRESLPDKLKKQVGNRRFEIRPSEYNDGVSVVIGLTEFTIINGDVTHDGYTDDEVIDVVEEEAAKIADILFRESVQKTLLRSTTLKGRTALRIDYEGKQQDATLFTCVSGKFSLKVYVLPGGQVQILTDGGSFVECGAISDKLLELINADGVEAKKIGQTETHAKGTHAHPIANKQTHTH